MLHFFGKYSKRKGPPEKCGRTYNVKTKFLYSGRGRRAKRGAVVWSGGVGVSNAARHIGLGPPSY